MSENIILPEILDIPTKLFPLIFDFNKYSRFLFWGGRGGGKSQSIARFLLFLAEQRKIRVVCGRELQTTINESVKTILSDLIKEYNLNFEISDKKIVHRITQSTFVFKGFREQGKVNIKGLEGVDILWIDEAEAIQKSTLDVIIPTIRKEKSKIIFTMNRHIRSDAVFVYCLQDPDCLKIKINYDENPHCPEILKKEAMKCKSRSINDYNHIWLGEPMENSKDFLVTAHQIDCAKNAHYKEDSLFSHSVMSVDLAGSGGDLNVLKLIKQVNSTAWQDSLTIKWSEPDTDITIGKIINFHSQYKPDILVLDADGVGYAITNSIKKTIENTIAFRGAGKIKNPNCNAINARAEGYLTLKSFIQNNFLKITDDETIRQIEYLKVIYKPSGQIAIQTKDEIRKEQGESPDYADSLMMGIYAIDKYSYLFSKNKAFEAQRGQIQTDFDPFY